MWIQFLLLWEDLHKEVMNSRELGKVGMEKEFAFSLRSSRVKTGEVLRASGSHARYGFVLISPQMGLPSDGC